MAIEVTKLQLEGRVALVMGAGGGRMGTQSAVALAEAGAKVIAAASTLQEKVREGLKSTGNVEAAKAVGRAIAERSKAAGVSKVAFDRSGFQFHGRVKALADAAREAGLEF